MVPRWTIVVNTIAELQPVFKTKTKHVIQCFTKVKKVFISPNFRIIFFWKKDWMRVSRLKLYYFDDFFCAIIVCWICVRVLMAYKKLQCRWIFVFSDCRNFWLEVRGHLLYLDWSLGHLCNDGNSSCCQFLPLDIQYFV